MLTIDSFLSQLCEHCGLSTADFSVEVNEEDGVINVQLNVPEDESGIFIGHHGETLDSIQRIIRIIFQKEKDDSRISLNVNDYRQKREEKLKDTARSVATRVIETGEEHQFKTQFTSQERFIIHSTISEDETLSGVESFSVGEGRDRRLVIRPKSSSKDE